MALHRPRRIFRSNFSNARRGAGGREMGRTVIAGLLGTTAIGALLLMLLPAQLFGRVPAMTGTVQAAAAGVAVVDGQTLRVGETVVRLQGVAAPARGTTCLQPDQRRFDCGTAATDALARLVHGKPLTCKLYGRDEAGFHQGLCEAGTTEVNRAIVAAGWARATFAPDGFAAASFSTEEGQARAASRGVWQGGPASF